MTNHIMIDLETMGTDHFSAILSIGAVHFDPNSDVIHTKFEINVDLLSATRAGLRMDAEAVNFWLNPERAAARDAWFAKDKFDLDTALHGFTLWLNDMGPAEDRRIWGNGANFDAPLLGDAYKALGMELPWSFYQELCFRTIKNLPGAKDCKPEDTGIAHTALSDAVYQAVWMQNILRKLNITI